MLFSQFEYNLLWPEQYVAKTGNLVSYKGVCSIKLFQDSTDELRRRLVHDFGGHFPGLDNPPALLEDIREMGLHYTA